MFVEKITYLYSSPSEGIERESFSFRKLKAKFLFINKKTRNKVNGYLSITSDNIGYPSSLRGKK